MTTSRSRGDTVFVFRTREGFLHFSQHGNIYLVEAPNVMTGNKKQVIYIYYNDENYILGEYEDEEVADEVMKNITNYMNKQMNHGGMGIYHMPDEEEVRRWMSNAS